MHPFQGRRRPFMVVGGIISSISLLVMAFAKSLGVFSSAFFFLSLSNNMIMAPYSALIPDVVSEEQVRMEQSVVEPFIGNTENERKKKSSLPSPVHILLFVSSSCLSQRGMSSGWLGAFSTFGFLCGGMVTYKIDLFGVIGCYFILIFFHAGAIAVTVKHIHETPLDVRLSSFWQFVVV
jgi:hypothetical protein